MQITDIPGYSPTACVRLLIDCETISGPGAQGGSTSEIEVASQEHEAGPPITPAHIRREDPKFPTAQQILNLAASKYLGTIDPSKPEDLNGLVYYLQEVRKVLIVDTQSGSLIITVECRSLEILDELWCDYCNGSLNGKVQKFLVTEEILQELGVIKVKLTTSILEEDYKACREYLLQHSGEVRSLVHLHVDCCLFFYLKRMKGLLDSKLMKIRGAGMRNMVVCRRSDRLIALCKIIAATGAAKL